MTAFDMFISSLAGIPTLPGARCRGKHHLFDAAAPGEDAATISALHNQALALCSRCRAKSRCEEWFSSLPPKDRPSGVVAGKIRTSPVGRPRKSTTTEKELTQ